ncbi:MAG: hypothetical protein ACW99A_10185 [Candidatus Kariarchaeaceae archaeon]|jgi:hypothetical protein
MSSVESTQETADRLRRAEITKNKRLLLQILILHTAINILIIAISLEKSFNQILTRLGIYNVIGPMFVLFFMSFGGIAGSPLGLDLGSGDRQALQTIMIDTEGEEQKQIRAESVGSRLKDMKIFILLILIGLLLIIIGNSI